MTDSDQAAATFSHEQRKAEMLADEDPLMISQSLTYVTDDGGILHSFQSAQFSTGTLTVVRTGVIIRSVQAAP
jgi:hypothetical protein